MQAETAPLQVLCAAQAGAQAISAAAGQAGQAGISPAFGKDPCKLFQGELPSHVWSAYHPPRFQDGVVGFLQKPILLLPEVVQFSFL